MFLIQVKLRAQITSSYDSYKLADEVDPILLSLKDHMTQDWCKYYKKQQTFAHLKTKEKSPAILCAMQKITTS